VFVPKLLQGMQTEIADIVQSRHAVAIMVSISHFQILQLHSLSA
jgi:hypothetical protein